MAHIQANTSVGNILEKRTLANRDELYQRVLSLLGNITKEMGLKVGYFVGFLHPTEETYQYKIVKSMNRFVNKYKNVVKEASPKAGCLAGFWHHRVTTMSLHTHAYHCPLFESGSKTGL